MDPDYLGTDLAPHLPDVLQVVPIETIREAQHSAEPAYGRLRGRVERGIQGVLFGIRERSSMEPRNEGYHCALLRFEREGGIVPDQLAAPAVMASPAITPPDVVKETGRREQVPLNRPETVKGHQRIEALEREVGHLLGVREIGAIEQQTRPDCIDDAGAHRSHPSPPFEVPANANRATSLSRNCSCSSRLHMDRASSWTRTRLDCRSARSVSIPGSIAG